MGTVAVEVSLSVAQVAGARLARRTLALLGDLLEGGPLGLGLDRAAILLRVATMAGQRALAFMLALGLELRVVS